MIRRWLFKIWCLQFARRLQRRLENQIFGIDIAEEERRHAETLKTIEGLYTKSD